MKVGWEVSKFGDVCAIELGKTPSRADSSYWDVKKQTNNIWLSIADLLNTENSVVSGSKEYLSDKGAKVSKKVAAGTLLVSFKLTLGRLAYTGCDLFTNEAIAALTIHNEKKLTKEFLYYFLMHFDWDKACDGDVKVKGKTLNKAKLKEIAIFYPNYSEQQRIVTILDEAFEQIAIARANTEKNLQNARALFESHLQSVFSVRGEPVEPRRPSTSSGRAGEGWMEVKFEDCFRLKSGDGLTSNQMKEGGVYSVFGGNGIAGYYDKHNLSGENVIIGRVGALCGNVRHITESIWLTDNAFKIVDFKFEFDLAFLTYLLNFKNLRNFARQTAQPVISNSSLKDVSLTFPKSISKQSAIVTELNGLRVETQRLESLYQRKLTALDELKKSLLHKAFAGEL